MSPTKFQDNEVTKGLINDHRPVPLRINKDSHSIHKPVDGYSPTPKHQNPASKRQPLIIYTHSPKIIHAQAHDFMALVQKLTGLTRSDDDNTLKSEYQFMRDDSLSDEKDSDVKKNVGYEENESCSLVTDENFIRGGEIKPDLCVVSPMYKISNPNLNPDTNPYIIEPLILNANSNEYFCSSRPNTLCQSPFTESNTISPAFMDYMKGFTKY